MKRFSIVGLVILLILTAAYFFFTNTPDVQLSETTTESQWKSFAHCCFGNYTVEYPSDWSFDSNEIGANFSDDKEYLEYGALAPGSYPAKLINITRYKTEQTLDQYVAAELQARSVPVEEITIAGNRGALLRRTVNGSNRLSAFTKQNDSIYILEGLVKNEEDVSGFEVIFMHMVGSFKFIN